MRCTIEYEESFRNECKQNVPRWNERWKLHYNDKKKMKTQHTLDSGTALWDYGFFARSVCWTHRTANQAKLEKTLTDNNFLLHAVNCPTMRNENAICKFNAVLFVYLIWRLGLFVFHLELFILCVVFKHFVNTLLPIMRL